MDVSVFVGIVIGIIGLIYAVYQGKEYRKLRDYNRTQAWYIYSKANNLTGLIQHAAAKYKEVYKNSIDSEVSELLSKGDAYGQELFKETIRQIQLAEPHFDYKAFERWISMGKLDKEHKPLFVQLSHDSMLKNG